MPAHFRKSLVLMLNSNRECVLIKILIHILHSHQQKITVVEIKGLKRLKVGIIVT